MRWLGGAIWLLFVMLVQPGWSAALFLLAPLVAIPLAMDLARSRFSLPSNMYLLFGDVLVGASYFFDQGLPAALLAVPWFTLTLWSAWAGWQGLLNRRNPWMSFGLMYLAIGGGWLVLARFGARPLEFPEVIVQATATHFHFAGCILPIVAGLAIDKLRRLWTRMIGWGIVAGVPLLAAGITLSQFGVVWLEALAAWFLAACCWAFALVQGRVALHERDWPRILLILSSLSLALGMVFAALYGARLFWQIAWLDIPTMLRYHGTLQALGFALPALLAWHGIKNARLARVDQVQAARRRWITGAKPQSELRRCQAE